jgi:hypothetical protein
MAVIYVGVPWDPETDLKNFERKQAELKAAYQRTRDPLVLHEALLHANAAERPAPDWLVETLGVLIMRDRTDAIAERFRERMRHVRRYRRVRDLRRKGLGKEDALDQAVAALEAAGEPIKRGTVEVSYDLVSRDLNKAGCESEYFHLVAKSDPTVVPVHPEVARTLAKKHD